MALDKEAIKLSYPLPAYNYKVTIDADTLCFSEVSGLQMEYEEVVYKHGLSYLMGVNIIRAQAHKLSITLKRGVAARRNYLYEWLKNKSKKDILIDLCDEKGNALVRWKVGKAMPLKMEAPTFNASNNEVAIESVELIAHNLDVEYL